MNKRAIVLAADSAATTGYKIYNSAEKLFSLSKYYPVGIMLYDNGAFMSIPWETVIKIYRDNLDKKHFPTLKEYAEDFIGYLDGNENIMPLELQEEYFRRIVRYKFLELKEGMEDFIEEHDSSTKRALNLISFILPDDISKEPVDESLDELKKLLLTDLLKESCDWFERKVTESWGILPDHFIEEFKNKEKIDFDNIIQEIANEIFDGMIFDKDPIEDLKKLAIYGFYENKSGVIISGFGDDDLFPSVVSYSISGMVNNNLKFILNKNESAEISFEDPARIIPFAQHEMVDAFLEGVTPEYHEYSEGYLDKLFSDFLPAILEIIEEIDDGSTEEKLIETLKEQLSEIESKKDILMSDYRNAMTEKKDEHKNPILMSVAALPKDELASMAESLVHLTSLKRKFSFDQVENVGGAIDVAIISKGDGFVWYKRKHYFKAELNHQFFNNYQLNLRKSKNKIEKDKK